MSEENVAQDIPEHGEPTLVDPPKISSKVSKIDQKRQQIFRDRMERFIAKGMTPEQAVEAIQREDYERLPVPDKIKRLEGALIGNLQAIAGDMSNLRKNQTDLADAMDVNFRGFEKILAKLGVSVEDQRAMLKEAEDEIGAERASPKKPAEEGEAPAPSEG